MSVINLYPEEPCLIPVQFLDDDDVPANPLTPYGKDYADITDIYMGIKKDPSELDDAYLAKYFKDGVGGGAETGDVLKDEGTHTFTMNKLEVDVLPIGTFGVYVGVLVSGLTKMLWLRVNKSDTIVVAVDGVKQ